jgi:hypothetical protein
MFRWVNVPMAGLFLFSASLQFNDPDPVRWVAIYTAAALVSVLAATRRVAWTFAGLVTVIALVWAAYLATRTVGRVDFRHVFDEFKMSKNDEVLEEAREMCGLLIVAFWCGLVTIWAKWIRKPVARPAPAAP